MGQALYAAQCGEDYPSVKVLKGFGGRSVQEIVALHDTNTYRARCAFKMRSTSCTLFRKSRRKVLPRHKRISI